MPILIFYPTVAMYDDQILWNGLLQGDKEMFLALYKLTFGSSFLSQSRFFPVPTGAVNCVVTDNNGRGRELSLH